MTSETIAYLLIAGAIGILFKIVWDWFLSLKKSNSNSIREICRQRFEMYEEEFYKIHDRLEKLEQRLEIALDRLNNKIDEKFELIIKILTKGNF
jgi:hypothetical protein